MKKLLKKYIKNYNSRFAMAYDIGISETALRNFLAGKNIKNKTSIIIENYLVRMGETINE